MKTKHKTKKRKTTSHEGTSKEGDVEVEENVSGEENAETVEENERRERENVDDSPWTTQKPVEDKSRDEEMEEYLDDLLL